MQAPEPSAKPCTEDGLPLLGVGGGDPELILRRVAEARGIPDPTERSVRLYFLGKGLLDCDDADPIDAVAVLAESMDLGSPHAAFELGGYLLRDAETPDEVAAALTLFERAALGGLVEAQTLLGKILMENPATRGAGQEWLRRAGAD